MDTDPGRGLDTIEDQALAKGAPVTETERGPTAQGDGDHGPAEVATDPAQAGEDTVNRSER